METLRTPVIVLTMYRRYHELNRALRNIKQRLNEFSITPKVILVWAQPEYGRLWHIDRLITDGLVHHVVSRAKLAGEGPGVATSYPESYNIRAGLEKAKQLYGPNCYFILQCADVMPRAGTYAFVDAHMQKPDTKAIVFHWANDCANHGVWHTNFFAVVPEPVYWPPLSPINDPDTLERQWGRYLESKNFEGIIRSHNSTCRLFTHDHLSEDLSEFPIIAPASPAELNLYVRGTISWRKRLRQWWCKLLRRKFNEELSNG